LAISVSCPQCSHALKAKDELAGKKVMCPKCQTVIVVPGAKGASVTSTPSTSPSSAATKPAVPIAPAITAEQLAAAFTGQIELPKVSASRRLGTWLVLLVLLLLVAVYFAILGGLAFGVYWLATNDLGPSIPSWVGSLAMAAAALLLLCLIRPLVMPRERPAEIVPLAADKQAILAEFVAKIAEQVHASPPAVLQAECSPRLEIDRHGRTLKLGLPLVMNLTVEQVGGLIAAQLAPHRRGAGSGPARLIRSINGWMWRSVYQEDRFDRWITRANLRPGFHLGRLLVPLRAFSFLARVVLWIPMFIGNTVAAVLTRESELDSDRIAARLIGGKEWTATIERVKVVAFTWEGILTELPFLYKEQQLPDSLPHFLAERMADVSPELAATLLTTVIKDEEIPFDSRPSAAEQAAAIAAEPSSGVLVSSLAAQGLVTDYGNLSRQASWDYYAARFGPQFLKTALRKTGS
jgi:membrane protein implicated in regulation of membrane protease activity